MKIDRNDDGYKLSDIMLTAAVLKSGISVTLDRIDKENANQSLFVLAGNPDDIKEIINKFFHGECVITDAKAFGECVRDLKSLVTSGF